MQLFKLNVTSLPEYILRPSRSTSPLKSVLGMSEFELRALARYTVTLIKQKTKYLTLIGEPHGEKSKLIARSMPKFCREKPRAY